MESITVIPCRSKVHFLDLQQELKRREGKDIVGHIVFLERECGGFRKVYTGKRNKNTGEN